MIGNMKKEDVKQRWKTSKKDSRGEKKAWKKENASQYEYNESDIVLKALCR